MSDKIIYIERGILGKGTFGCVNLVLSYEDASNPHFMAVKTFKNNRDYKLEKKINLLVSDAIDKKHIMGFVKMLSYDDSLNKIYFEYINGLDIFDFCNNFFDRHQKFTLNFITLTFRGIVQAVAALHEIGIIHVDIKPNNFLIDASMNIKIIDFSHSAKIGSECHGFYQGKAQYMPPECEFNFIARNSIDVFEIGATLMMLIHLDYNMHYMRQNSYIPSVYISSVMRAKIMTENENESQILAILIQYVTKSLDIKAANRPPLHEAFTISTSFKKVDIRGSFNFQSAIEKELFSYHKELQKFNHKFLHNQKQLDDIKLMVKQQATEMESSKLEIHRLSEQIKDLQRENMNLKEENQKLHEKKDKDDVDENINNNNNGCKECISQNSMELPIPTTSVNTQESCETSKHVNEIEDNSTSCQNVDPLALCEASLQLSPDIEHDILSNMPVFNGYENDLKWILSNKHQPALRYKECTATKRFVYPKKATAPPMTVTYVCRINHSNIEKKTCQTKIVMKIDEANAYHIKTIKYDGEN